MNVISKRWTQKKKRSIAFLLVCITFLMLPLNAHASANSVATPSNIDLDINMENDFSNVESLEAISYEDYQQTFVDYPLTLVNSNKSRFAITTSVVAIFVSILAVCGIYVSSTSATSIFTRFESWLRTFYGKDIEAMNTWQLILSGTFATTIVGMARFLPIVKEFLSSTVSGYGNGALDLTFDDKNIITEPFYLLADKAVAAGVGYKFSAKRLVDSKYIYFCDYYFEKSVDLSQLVIVRSSQSFSSDYEYQFYFYDVVSDALKTVSFSYAQMTYNVIEDYYTYPTRLSGGSYFSLKTYDSERKSYEQQLPFLIFSDTKYALSYFKSGTMGGLISGQTTSITADKAWTQLQQDALDRFGDTLTLPSEEEWATIQDRLSSSATADDVLGALDGVFEIQGTINPPVEPPLSPSVAYSNLSYVITMLAGYCGIVLTKGQIDDFISSFYSDNISGTSALVDVQSKDIIRNFVVINGGLGSPNDDNNKNNYKVLKHFAISLALTLVSLGLISESPSFENEPVINNVNVVEVLPTPSPNPNPSPDIDLSGIIGHLIKIVEVLNNWTNPFGLIDAFVEKLNLPSISTILKSTILELPKLISDELTLPELFSSVIDAIFSMPLQVSQAIANALGLENLFDSIYTDITNANQWLLNNLGLNGLIDNIVNVIELLPDKLVSGFALSNLFDSIATVVGNVPSSIANLFGLTDGFSFSGLFTNLGNEIRSLPDALWDKFSNNPIKPSEPSDDDKQDGGEKKFRNFINSILMLAFILVALLFFFLNCLRLITLIFAIPANTDLFNDDIMRGLTFLKSVEIPFFHMYLYDLLMGAVYFVVFMGIIATIRRKINHIRIKG